MAANYYKRGARARDARQSDANVGRGVRWSGRPSGLRTAGQRRAYESGKAFYIRRDARAIVGIRELGRGCDRASRFLVISRSRSRVEEDTALAREDLLLLLLPPGRS